MLHPRPRVPCSVSTVAYLLLAGACAAGGALMPGASRADEPIAAPQCALRLSIEVTPDVPNAASGEFLSSLLGNHAGFQLFLLQVVDDSHIDVQLQGPGPAQSCRAVVEAMRNDGRVASIDVH